LARGELRKAARHATVPLTRGRVLEGLAMFAWESHDLEAALAHLAEAEEIYARAEWAAGTARVLEKRAIVLRGAGRLQEALRLEESRIEVPASLGRPDALALALSDRGALLVILGRWEEARRDFDQAAALFHARGDAREITVAAVGRAVVDLATGDLSRIRTVLDKARERHAEHANTRLLSHTLLRVSEPHAWHDAAGVDERE